MKQKIELFISYGEQQKAKFDPADDSYIYWSGYISSLKDLLENI